MNAETRQYARVISTKAELEHLVHKALGTGLLDLKNCKIDVPFNLAELLVAFGQEEVPCENKPFCKYTVECPFWIFAIGACFTKNFSARSKNEILGVDDTAVIFKSEANFMNTNFSGGVSFMNATFSEKATFGSSTFTGEVNFMNATFSGKVNFSCATFTEGADFWSATFHKHTSFKEVKIPKNAKLYFKHITTHDYLGIIPSVLNGIITITDPSFESEKRSLVVDFEHCDPDSQGSVEFQGIEVDADRVCLKIRNLKEDSSVKVHFQDCGFYGKNVAFTNVAMKQVSIAGGNYVSGMAFYYCKWAKEPTFLGLEFRAFNRLISTDIPKISESYSNLKVRALEAGDAQLSNDFHFWHQWYQWETLYQAGLWNWNYFYLITSAYGLSARLPFGGFVYVLLIFTGLYASFFQQPLINGFLSSLSASIPFVFNDVEVINKAIGSITDTKNLWFYPLYILQHLVQGYLLFQIGAAIRNKVKR